MAALTFFLAHIGKFILYTKSIRMIKCESLDGLFTYIACIIGAANILIACFVSCYFRWLEYSIVDPLKVHSRTWRKLGALW